MSAISPRMLEKLGERGESRLYHAADIVFAIGDAGDEMYLIEEGMIELFFEPGKSPKYLGPGELFGELAYIVGNHVRTASAVALEESRLRVFDQGGLDELLACMPRELFQLARNACGYLVRSEQALLRQIQRQDRELEFSLDFAGRTRAEFECFTDVGVLDGGSGLFSRDCLARYLRKLDEDDYTRERPIGVMVLRVDSLSRIGERLGAVFEERMLSWVSETLRSIIQRGDLAARLGEESFAVLLLGADRAALENAQAHLQQRLANAPVRLPGGGAALSAAFGLADSEDGIAARDLLIDAESEVTAVSVVG